MLRDLSASDWCIDITDNEFETEVIERSMSMPVIIDFWAEWCGPCRQLGPLLERAAKQANGAFVLVKMNVDECQGWAGRMQISGIPAIRVLQEGKLVDGFDGLLDEASLQEFLGKFIPSASDHEFDYATSISAAEPDRALELFQKILKEKPEYAPAKLAIAKILIEKGEYPAAEAILSELGVVDEIGQEAERLRKLLALKQSADPHAQSKLANLTQQIQANVDDFVLRIERAKLYAAEGRYEEALADFLHAAELGGKATANEVKPFMVQIFEIIGVRSELSDAYRAQLQSMLY